MKRLSAFALAILMMGTLPAVAGEGPEAWEWDIGPVIKGRNYSVNMPRSMFETRDGPAFDFPYPRAENGHVHYVTVPVRTLKGAKRMVLTYRIDARKDVRFIPQEFPQREALLSLYFQRAGDRWTRRYPTYRWYAPNARTMPLSPGKHTVSIDFDEPWIAMMGGDNRTFPRAFDKALDDAMRVGFVFGSAGGRGHGVYATGPARFTVLDFHIE
ncbi:hypothetical protein [Altererythrobacter sp.]|uniref:hypothetical protein n=1 Tax=Altererythrobacter sp. TaxID=1872480 RepID=UPI003D04989C